MIRNGYESSYSTRFTRSRRSHERGNEAHVLESRNILCMEAARTITLLRTVGILSAQHHTSCNTPAALLKRWCIQQQSQEHMRPSTVCGESNVSDKRDSGYICLTQHGCPDGSRPAVYLVHTYLHGRDIVFQTMQIALARHGLAPR